MVDDYFHNLVKQLLAEWLVHFGTREVDINDVLNSAMGYVIFNQHPNSDIWEFILNEREYIHYDSHRETWHLTDAGVKHLQ